MTLFNISQTMTIFFVIIFFTWAPGVESNKKVSLRVERYERCLKSLTEKKHSGSSDFHNRILCGSRYGICLNFQLRMSTGCQEDRILSSFENFMCHFSIDMYSMDHGVTIALTYFFTLICLSIIAALLLISASLCME
ncbi:MAG: hypothetical protein MHMPM18_002493 [Marteilia pararefringens]